MSTAVFPSFIGLAWGVKKKPHFSTQVQTAYSGRELRSSAYSEPLWEFNLTYDVLRANVAYQELQQLVGFFLARRGRFDSFYYTDPDDCQATDVSLGNAVSGQLTYKLKKTFGGFSETIGALNGSPVIKLNGVTQSGALYTVGKNSITFLAQPTVGQPLTGTYAYYYDVRFKKDEEEFEQFLKDLWKLSKLELVSVKS